MKLQFVCKTAYQLKQWVLSNYPHPLQDSVPWQIQSLWDNIRSQFHYFEHFKGELLTEQQHFSLMRHFVPQALWKTKGKQWNKAQKAKIYFRYRGDGTNSFPIDLNTNILENTTPFLRIAATLVYRSFELVNSKFKQAKKNNMLCCILDSRVNSYPTTVCGTAFSWK